MNRTVVTVNGDDVRLTVHSDAVIDRCSFTVSGHRAAIVIGASVLRGCNFVITGSDNAVTVGNGCMLQSTVFVCEDDGNAIVVGDGTEVHGTTQLAALEGTRITVGERCLFSGGIHIRTGDSHTVTDLAGRRINRSQDVAIGDHVWVGQNVTMLKGSAVAPSSIVGASAVVTRRFDEPHCALGGNPARVIRRDIDWLTERVPLAPEEA